MKMKIEVKMANNDADDNNDCVIITHTRAVWIVIY